MIYILDTNAISDYIKQFEPTTTRIKQAIRDGQILYLCKPVEYEVLRGLMKANAERQRQIFETGFAPQLTLLPLTDADWRQAAQFWAQARSAGKQLSDVDLLLAALAFRLNAVIVTNDDDFDALPVRRENWRQAPTDDDES
ncbi:type II toxin-antitoxin system VapC family toxin [Anaerolineae bacterium CFX9]|nr:type II toxin-antitoxin system VapC family toxin [Anaerolineae bacterium CFX9]